MTRPVKSTGATISLMPEFAAGVVDPTICRHPPLAKIALSSGLMGGAGATRVALDAFVCLDCGLDVTGSLDPFGAIQAIARKYGWHAAICGRCFALARALEHLWWERDAVFWAPARLRAPRWALSARMAAIWPDWADLPPLIRITSRFQVSRSALLEIGGPSR